VSDVPVPPGPVPAGAVSAGHVPSSSAALPGAEPAAPVTSGLAAGPVAAVRRRRTAVALAAAGGVLVAVGVTLAFIADGDNNPSARATAGGGRYLADPEVRPGAATTAGTGDGASPSRGAAGSSGSAGAGTASGTAATATAQATGGEASGGPVATTTASPAGGTADPTATAATTAPTTAAATTTAPADTACADGGGAYDCTVVKAAKSFDDDGNKVGTVGKGVRSFSCQADLGRSRTRAGVTTTWWARTDDDSGNSGVWITDAVLQGAVSGEPVSGLPTC
jgi:hypothetical protein